MNLRALCSLAWGAITEHLDLDQRAEAAGKAVEPMAPWWSERPQLPAEAKVRPAKHRVVNLSRKAVTA